MGLEFWDLRWDGGRGVEERLHWADCGDGGFPFGGRSMAKGVVSVLMGVVICRLKVSLWVWSCLAWEILGFDWVNGMPTMLVVFTAMSISPFWSMF